ncbi:hypothetical protein CLF_100234, partial [Clonorchis sinensis]
MNLVAADDVFHVGGHRIIIRSKPSVVNDGTKLSNNESVDNPSEQWKERERIRTRCEELSSAEKEANNLIFPVEPKQTYLGFTSGYDTTPGMISHPLQTWYNTGFTQLKRIVSLAVLDMPVQYPSDKEDKEYRFNWISGLTTDALKVPRNVVKGLNDQRVGVKLASCANTNNGWSFRSVPKKDERVNGKCVL